MELGAFSISLAVKDLEASRKLYRPRREPDHGRSARLKRLNAVYP